LLEYVWYVNVEVTGYKGRAYSLLKERGVVLGAEVLVRVNGGEYRGIIMPRYELADDEHIVIKLRNGYNIGLHIDNIIDIIGMEGARDITSTHTGLKRQDDSKEKPRIALISTGGTIASRIDYRTGGVRAALSADELYTMVPELNDIASIDTYPLMQEYSENITHRHWSMIAEDVKEKIEQGYDGVVVAHGTDTMHYTSAALSFALQNLPVPVVLVGSQRSSDRPSSDASLNLLGSVLFASYADATGVFVSMHAESSDDRIALHIGTKVRKNHTSSRDAFESIDTTPIAYVDVDSKSIDMRVRVPRRDKSRRVECRSRFDDKTALLKFYPNFDPAIIEYLVSNGYRGLVIEGTGLGHVGSYCFDALRRAIDSGMLVYMTSQCIWGRLRMSVYSTGRDLLNIGVVPLNMLSEVAYVKLSWALANFADEARSIMLKDTAMEFK
jgi:glutamyl-tRNA(Gln) amidotransferase subunit D